MTKTSAATPPLLRRVNAGKLLGVLSSAGVMTGTGLIEATGLTRATVHAVCNDLIGMGWVVELDPGRDDPVPSAVRPGGSSSTATRGTCWASTSVPAKTTVLVANLRGETVAKAGRSFTGVEVAGRPDRGGERGRRRGDRGRRGDGAEVIAAGVGLAAPVDREGNILVDDEFWRRFDAGLATRLSQAHGWPVLLENDANLAALGEHWRGEAPRRRRPRRTARR